MGLRTHGGMCMTTYTSLNEKLRALKALSLKESGATYTTLTKEQAQKRRDQLRKCREMALKGRRYSKK